jgi:hypothetical protein
MTNTSAFAVAYILASYLVGDIVPKYNLANHPLRAYVIVVCIRA